MLGKTNQILKKLVYAGIVAAVFLACAADKAMSAPDSNSIVINDVEFYVETDKSIYSLGENVEMLYRLTKLGFPSATIPCHQDPPLNLVVLKDGKTIWMKVQGWWQVIVDLPLFPNIPVEITSSWDMNDLNGVPAGPGTYDVLGVIYDTIGIPDVGVQITILPIPCTITVGLGAGYDFNTIQAAIDDAYDGDTIIVADGIYTGDGNRDIDFLGKAITLCSENGPENCIIDCNGTESEPHRGFYFHSQEDSNSVLAGFTVTNGHGLLWYPFPVPAGGAIFCKNSSPRITNCIIKNSNGGFGGGILCHSSSPVISDCTVSSNSAVEGGGMYNYENSCVELINCTFRDNFVSLNGRGGGIVNMQSNTVISRCIFVNNYGGGGGGGVCNLDCSPTFTDCRFIGNSAPVLFLSGRCGGGGIYNAGSSPSMTNCIFSGNHGSGGDAMSNVISHPILTNCTFTGSRGFTAIYNWWENINLTLRNCILWDQTENEINDSNVTITYSNVKGGWFGLGNIDVDPCFVDPGYWDSNGTPEDANDDIWIDGDYHLKSQAGRWEPASESWVQDDVTSPCIDAGNPGCPLGDEPAPNGNRRNMGAYGGKAEASKSPINWRSIADLTNDWVVDSNDLKV
ncbi:MAG: right-handed parallel beta-helix repeat-containing protein, partial [Planctomycetota bacterium]